MDFPLGVLLGELFVGTLPIWVVATIFLILRIVERAEEKREEKREERRQREKEVEQ